MTATKFKNGYIYKINPDEIFSIHYVPAWTGEDIHDVYKRISDTWGRGKPAFLFNAELYNTNTMKPASSVVEKGKVHAMFEGHGLAFIDNKKPVWSYKNNVNAPDYIGVYPTLVRNGKRDLKSDPAGLGGSRGRTAIATDKEGCFYICLVADGNNDATLREVADALLKAGATDGGNLDGGGSTQWYAPNGKHYTGRRVRGYIAVWLNEVVDNHTEPTLDIRTVAVRTSLNVRDNPSLFSRVIDRLYNGEKVQIIETKGLWCRIPSGWVSSLYLRK